MTVYLQVDPMPDLNDRGAVKLVQKYYKRDGLFSGRHFEFLDCGDNRPELECTITAEDLVAVSMLSINIPGSAAWDILVTHREEISELLREIPLGVTLWEADESDVDDDHSKAAELWKLLEKIRDVGWVTANKLLARKRPQLLPVYDRIVKAKLQPRSDKLWIPLRNSLLRNDQAMVNRLQEIRHQAHLSDEPPLLRILDVVLWMGSERSKR